MKSYMNTVGPFRERPFYTQSDIENMCLDELSRAELLPSKPAPIRIERFIEKRFKVSPSYEDLPDGVLGLTKFTDKGVREIVVSRALEEEGSEVAERRIRTTLGHETGHGLLHSHLFVLALNEQPMFGDFSDPKKPKVLCRDSTKASYNGQWWEYQANQVMGAILMPKPLMLEAVEPFLASEGLLGIRGIAHDQRESVVKAMASLFDVNPVVARIRLAQFYPAKVGQMSL